MRVALLVTRLGNRLIPTKDSGDQAPSWYGVEFASIFSPTKDEVQILHLCECSKACQFIKKFKGSKN